ncbi:hypothetical protein XELAEV_180295401mg, partial [Xenopus laevis]
MMACSSISHYATQSDLPVSLSWQLHVEDTGEMLPKSRRALTIHEITALARSSLH